MRSCAAIASAATGRYEVSPALVLAVAAFRLVTGVCLWSAPSETIFILTRRYHTDCIMVTAELGSSTEKFNQAPTPV